MSDLGSTNYSETDASNNAIPPNGWPEGMNPSDVNNSARANMGAAKRFWNRANSVKTTGGTSTAYTLTYDVAAASYYNGEEHSFVVNATCGATPTLNINGLGAKNIRKLVGTTWTNLAAGDVVTNQPLRVRYNSIDDKFDITVLVQANATDILTTRGDVLTRDASAYKRLALGTVGQVLSSDGTDLRWLTRGNAFELLGVDSAGSDLEYKRPGWQRVAADASPSSASAVTFSSIPSSVKALMVTFELVPATNDVNLQLRLSRSGALVTSSDYYLVQAVYYNLTNSFSSGGAVASATTSVQVGTRVRNSTSGNSIRGIRGHILIPWAGTGDPIHGFAQSTNTDVAGNYLRNDLYNFFVNQNGPCDGFSLYFSSGNIASGFVSAQGLYA